MSGLFGKHPNSVIPNRLNGIALNQSIYGRPYPLVYGKTRVSPFCVWYGDFKATAQTQSGGGKGGHGQTTGYTYSAALILALCEGPITSAPTSYVDRSSIADHTTLGWSLALGSAGQGVWSYLTTNHPTQAIGYDHTAYVFGGPYQLGSSAAVPNSSFEIVALLSNSTYAGDAAPAAIISDYCTDATHGAGFNALAPLTGANSYDTYCQAMGFFLSPKEETQRSAIDFLKEIAQVTNSNGVWSGTQLKIIPYGDVPVTGNGVTWTPSNGNGGAISTPIYTFGDDDFLTSDKPVVETRKPTLLTKNYYTVEYLDRAQAYNSAVATASDAKDISLNGERAAAVLSFHAITTVSVARTVAQLILQRDLYYRNTVQFKVRADYCLLEAMDVVAITDTSAGINDQLVRIIEIQDDPEDVLTITAEELPLGPGGTPQYNWDGAQGYMDNALASPGSVDPPYIFAIPALMVSGNGGFELGMAVAGTGMWGGCNVYMSLDGGTVYQEIGTIVGPARYGTLTAAFASGSAEPTPDTVNTLSISLTDSQLTISPASQADVDNYRTMMIVDGELMSYRDATLVSAGNYSLAYFRRGLYGATVSAHASGSSWARIDSSLFRIPFDPGLAGQTANFKFCSFNIFGRATESLAAVTAYPHVIGSPDQPDLSRLVCSGVTATNSSAFKNTSSVGWDASCYTDQSYSTGCSAEGYFTQAYLGAAFGLSTNPGAGPNNVVFIEYGWISGANGHLYFVVNGTQTDLGLFTPSSTLLQITYDQHFVTYWMNGVIKKRLPLTGATFFFMASFYSPQAGVDNIRFAPHGALSPSQFIARGNTMVTNTSVIKNGGASMWDSDAYGMVGLGACHIVFKPGEQDKYLMVGLVPNIPDTPSYATLTGIYCVNGIYSFMENGALIQTYTSYLLGDYFAVTYDGLTTVTFWRNHIAIGTFTVAAGSTFYPYVILYSPGATAGTLEFGAGKTFPLTDPSKGGLAAKGSTPPSVPAVILTYTSTTTSATISWSAFTIYRADGTITSVVAGSQAISGLTASTSYKVYAYFDDLGTAGMQFSTGGTGVGSPAMAYPSGGDPVAANTANLNGNVPLGSLVFSTPASGSGGGGGGYGCLHPEQLVLSGRGEMRAADLRLGDTLTGASEHGRIVSMRHPRVSEWVRATFNDDYRMTVTRSHWFMRPDGERVAAGDLTLGMILMGRERHVCVTGLDLVADIADAVSFELDAPHLYTTHPNGPVCHNVKP